MNDSKMLSYIKQNTDMGITGIEKVVKHSTGSGFTSVLNKQLADYKRFSDEAERLIRKSGGTEEELPTMAKMGSELMASMKCMSYDSDRKIAEDMIKGSSTGVIKLTGHLRDYGEGNHEVTELARRVIAYEEAGIEELKKYL